MKKSRLLGAICAGIISFVSMSSHAALISKLGGQAVYDNDLNITWLADTNLAVSNTFGLSTGVSLGTHPDDTSGWDGIIKSNGSMNWPGALFWLDAMNDANYLGFDDWRLPTSWWPDNSSIDEMSHLYFDEFGASGWTVPPPSPWGLWATGDPTEIAKFTNIGEFIYWTSSNSGTGAYFFDFFRGDPDAGGKLNEFRVMVVRTGEVPVPTAFWLFGSGLLGLVGVARRKKAAQLLNQY